ncbi:hypothetical protein C8J57DRAFT_1382948 [Mycena rebaudengoi]|nr:hypothetical protein C8J57DRAFT_1382948 [Mycena rebaudengoi]
MSISSMEYSISSLSRVPWTIAQEKIVSQEFPLNVQNESPEEFVARMYLQFLWLPESIMPLGLVAPSMLRVPWSDPSQPHPLHALLERLLLTTRAVTNKYHVELPYILANGGGEGEEEESVMWFAVTHEKSDNDEEEPWRNDAWRSKWMERMERREVQIQIILCLLKLSLPGPMPLPAVDSPNKKRRKLGDPPPPSLEDRLEAFMDKLSMWQLVGTLEDDISRPKDGRDWMQTFCEELVEPRFGASLPAQIALFKSKVFPNSPFSDSDDSDDARATSPDIPAKRVKSVAASASTSRRTLDEPVRSRSRSLSVSIAEEREREQRQREGSQKRVLNREVSMKRVFKPREHDPKAAEAERNKEKAKVEAKQRAEELQLAAAKEKERSMGIMLVADTPVKSRVRPTVNRGSSQPGASTSQQLQDDD